MSQYRHDMSGERNPKKQMSEGWNTCKVVSCKEETSKKGNPMFVIDLTLESDPSITSTIYAVATPGKRWFLKQFLSACDVPAGADGIYEWEISDVVGKSIQARVEIEQEKWTNREGVEVVTPKAKIVEFSSEIPF
jgi:hypothetical protein